MFEHIKDLHPAAQVAAIVMGSLMMMWFSYWIILWFRELFNPPSNSSEIPK